MSHPDLLKAVSRPQREMLECLKSTGPASTAELARRLKVTDEAARRHILNLESQGWITGTTDRSQGSRAGRPVTLYQLTDAGDHLFPKRYDDLSLALLKMVVAVHGEGALKETLASIVDLQVAGWEERLAGKSLTSRMEILRGFYLEDDPFITIEQHEGNPVLVERNCPFQNVAHSEPRLCSTTVATLSRLLGYRVERTQRMQNGDGRCAFQVLLDQPIDPESYRFEFEPEPETGTEPLSTTPDEE